MRRTLLLLFAMLAVGLSAPAAAAEKRPKILVLDVRAAGNFDPRSATVLSSLVTGEAARYPAKVIAGADLRDLVGLERQQQLMGCTENSCMAQIGGALGVEFILAPDVGEFGGRWILGVVLLDVARATAVHRVTRVSATQGGLVDQVGSAVEEAMASFGTPAPRSEPKPESGPTASKPETAPAAAVQAPAKAPTRVETIAGFSLIGVGAAAAIGGVVAGVLAKQEHDGAVARPPSDVAAARASVDAKLWVADGLFVGAAVAGAVGLVLVLTAPSSSPPATVAFAPAPGGGSLVFQGGF